MGVRDKESVGNSTPCSKVKFQNDYQLVREEAERYKKKTNRATQRKDFTGQY